MKIILLGLPIVIAAFAMLAVNTNDNATKIEWQRMSAIGTTWVAVDDGMILREQLRLTVPYGVEKIYIEAEKKRVE